MQKCNYLISQRQLQLKYVQIESWPIKEKGFSLGQEIATNCLPGSKGAWLPGRQPSQWPEKRDRANSDTERVVSLEPYSNMAAGARKVVVFVWASPPWLGLSDSVALGFFYQSTWFSVPVRFRLAYWPDVATQRNKIQISKNKFQKSNSLWARECVLRNNTE